MIRQPDRSLIDAVAFLTRFAAEVRKEIIEADFGEVGEDNTGCGWPVC